MMATHEPLRVLQIVVVMDRGGIETMLMNHYRAIDRSKVQFDFLVHGDKHGVYEDEILALGGRIHRIRAVRTPWDLMLWRKELYHIFKTNAYSAVHSHLEVESRLILKEAERAGAKLRIAHSHNTRSLRPLHKKIAGQLFEWLVPWRATDFWAASQMAGAWLFGEKICQQPHFRVFKNAIDCELFRFESAKRLKKRHELNLSENTWTLLHVGRFMAQKNHKFILEIMREVAKERPNAILLLAGTGPLEDEILHESERMGLKEHIRFLGSRSDVPELMQATDMFVLPSLYEGLPVVALEAQCAGLPCFLSDTITPEAKVTDLLEFLPLREAGFWTDKILSSVPVERKDKTEKFISAGWDIHQNSKWLERFYLEKTS